MRKIKTSFEIIKELNSFDKSRIPLNALSTVFTVINDLILNVLFLPFIVSAVSNNYSIETLFIGCVIMILLREVIETFNSWYKSVYIPKSNIKIERSFKLKLFDKAENVDLIRYDDTEFYNNYVWVTNDISSRAIETLDIIFDWINSVMMVAAVMGIIISFEPVIIICTVFPSIISLLYNKRINKSYYDCEQNIIPCDRKLNYVNKVFTSVPSAKEIRLYKNLKNVIIDKIFKSAYNIKLFNYNKYNKKIAFMLTSVELLTILFSHVFAMIYVGYKAIVSKTLDAGLVITLTNSIWQVSMRINTIAGIFNSLSKNNRYIKNYQDFLNMKIDIDKNENGIKADKKAKSIRLENISFKYPGNDYYTIKNINLNIKKGEKIAIVGYNGAGKTTLIKLIMRLYNPDNGRVLINNINASNYELKSLRSQFGIMFQDFQLYAMNVKENITMELDSDIIDDRIIDSLKKSNLYEKISKEELGIYSNVLKEYDKNGIILSGGQAQKLALARVYAKEYGVIILDEPSSALDPLSDYKMHSQMMKVCGDKTVIMISHRLSSTRDFDRIIYLENGKILEEGTHDELICLNGKYAEMYNIQADKYR